MVSARMAFSFLSQRSVHRLCSRSVARLDPLPVLGLLDSRLYPVVAVKDVEGQRACFLMSQAAIPSSSTMSLASWTNFLLGLVFVYHEDAHQAPQQETRP